MNKKAILNKVAIYMGSKGKFLSQDEYKKAKDKPYNFMALRRTFQSWARIKQLIEVNYPGIYDKKVEEVKPKKAKVVSTKPAVKKAVKKED